LRESRCVDCDRKTRGKSGQSSWSLVYKQRLNVGDDCDSPILRVFWILSRCSPSPFLVSQVAGRIKVAWYTVESSKLQFEKFCTNWSGILWWGCTPSRAKIYSFVIHLMTRDLLYRSRQMAQLNCGFISITKMYQYNAMKNKRRERARRDWERTESVLSRSKLSPSFSFNIANTQWWTHTKALPNQCICLTGAIKRDKWALTAISRRSNSCKLVFTVERHSDSCVRTR